MEIKVDGLRFSYNKKNAVLSGADARFCGAGISVLTGANGSGKTTLGKLITGLLKPDGGRILFDGADTAKMSSGERARRIGYLFQNPDLQLFAPTVLEELTFPFELTDGLTEDKRAEINVLLSRFGFTGAENRFPLTMSGGEKQRLALATIMSRNVEFLILDEPTSAIDEGARGFITEFINGFAKEGGVLVISHDKGFISALDHPRVFRLEGGLIYEA